MQGRVLHHGIASAASSPPRQLDGVELAAERVRQGYTEAGWMIAIWAASAVVLFGIVIVKELTS